MGQMGRIFIFIFFDTGAGVKNNPQVPKKEELVGWSSDLGVRSPLDQSITLLKPLPASDSKANYLFSRCLDHSARWPLRSSRFPGWEAVQDFRCLLAPLR